MDAEIRSLKFDIQDYRPVFTEAEMDEYYDAVLHKGLWTDFCEQIYFPGDKNGRMMGELLHLPAHPQYRWAFERDDSHVPDYDKGFVLKDYKACLI